MVAGGDDRGTRHVRVQTPPGGDADRHPGSPRLAEGDAGQDPADPGESSGHPHGGHPHRAEGDEQLPGEWERHRSVPPPEQS